MGVNYNEIIENIMKTFNKGFKTDEYNTDYLIDGNNEFFTTFRIEKIKEQTTNNTKRVYRRKKGGFINLVMRKEFINNQSTTTVNILKKCGISTHDNFFIHKSCLVFAIFNSNIKDILTNKTKYHLAKYSSTLFYNFETRNLESILLPILRNNEPPINQIQLKNESYHHLNQQLKIDRGIEIIGDKKSTHTLKLNCIENHFFPDFEVYSIHLPYDQSKKKDKEKVSSMTMLHNILKIVKNKEKNNFGITPFTSQELIENFEVNRINENLKRILKDDYDVEIKSFHVFKGIENEFIYKDKKNKKEKKSFDATVYFDIETAPHPDTNIATYYLGVAKIVYPNKEEYITDYTDHLNNPNDKKAFATKIKYSLTKNNCKNVIFIAHNVTFDIPLLLEGITYVKSHLVRNGKFVTGKYLLGKDIEITVIDMWRLTNTSLAKATKNFGLIDKEKLDFPHHLM
jgi:hypothetical protein